ncbi:MAG: 5-(carboxyamino)imidazole ribonucleotide synthase [Methylococcales symbiont of Iophon sp. n. MRB-2018]|nr:MAG: 5-(carboxyamino)imidazole ribonucleotide synthase [Methylococcales symbiont of Iophon sp. n. MRB-2018]KAF3980573.1 MAG: 5-(carboxyamino)imidazole ribonucleotide synthase [Methylococcales symbiont of Iophon sp. n. MRB-2018]
MKIGILGGGQLARMLALSGYSLGLEFIILDPSKDAGATGLGKHLQGKYDDPTLLAKLAEEADVITYEFENVSAEAASFLSQHTQVYPAPNALSIAQDRLQEKNFFHKLNIPTANFATIASLEDLQQAMTYIAYPAILKSRRMGYDGKGQIVLKSAEQLAKAWSAMQGVASIVESFVPFQREISIIAAKRASGEVVFYPVSENTHNQGILRVSECCKNDDLQHQAEDYVVRILTALDYVGIIALELFDINGRLFANEFAPRVHNSGHWTIEGAETSQFENHLRAITDLPLGSTEAREHTAMVNFIGGLPLTERILEIPHSHIHLYDKAPRKGRKLAHATIRTGDFTQYSQSLQRLKILAESTDDS